MTEAANSPPPPAHDLLAALARAARAYRVQVARALALIARVEEARDRGDPAEVRRLRAEERRLASGPLPAAIERLEEAEGLVAVPPA